jgi:transcriptional regulator NrdR family protein
MCGNDDSSVKRTTHEEADGDPCIKRERLCGDKKCSHRFTTYECYEPAGTDRAFDQGEARALVERAMGWLKAPATNIPIVRDARELLCKVYTLLN